MEIKQYRIEDTYYVIEQSAAGTFVLTVDNYGKENDYYIFDTLPEVYEYILSDFEIETKEVSY